MKFFENINFHLVYVFFDVLFTNELLNILFVSPVLYLKVVSEVFGEVFQMGSELGTEGLLCGETNIPFYSIGPLVSTHYKFMKIIDLHVVICHIRTGKFFNCRQFRELEIKREVEKENFK